MIEYNASSIDGIDLHLAHKDILPDPGPVFSNSIAGVLYLIGSLDGPGILDLLIQNTAGKASAGVTSTCSPVYELCRSLLATNEARLMDAANNPFTRAFESTMGKGLAGVLGGITFNWLDGNVPWETDYNARAPHGVDISFNFDVIHDIPPGLGHDGYNRAQLYNVGNIMRNVAGDVYSDGGDVGEFKFKEAGVTRTKGEKRGKP